MSESVLARTLDEVAAVARRAGADPDVARTEALQLAASVAESSPGAFVDWAEALGGEPDAAAFVATGHQGRRWRTSPIPTLAELARIGSPQTAELAEALVEVCTSAATLGHPGPETLGAAELAAQAQRRVLQRLTPPTPAPAVPAPPTPGVAPGTDVAALAPALWGRVMAQLRASTRAVEELHRQRSVLDLDPDTPVGPGAFGDLSSAAPPAPTPTGPTPTDPTPGVPAPTAPAPAPADEPVTEEPSAEEPEPATLEELLAELDALIGLESVKAEIHRQAAMLKIEKLRAEQGLKNATITRHLVFTGNPGTGKTTVARLVAGIYRALGLLSKGQLVEVDRSELVAGYLGQTAMKTAEVVASAEGGVLFIDEAYSLTGDQYGTEAVDTLVKEMEDRRDDLVVIVAGYPLPMSVFVAQNPGLASRFRTTIAFEDYTDDELGAILDVLCTGADYDLHPEARARFAEILTVTPRGSTFGNGRFARNCLEAAIGRHAWRLRDAEAPDVATLRTLLAEDFELPRLTPPDPLAPEPGTAEVTRPDADTVHTGPEQPPGTSGEQPLPVSDRPVEDDGEDPR